MTAVLAEVSEGDDVTRLVVVAALVGNPNLYLVNRHTAGYVRHGLHRALVVVAEEIGEEEMAVLIVVVAAYVKTRQLRSALAAYRLRFAVLLRDKSLYLQLAELQVRLDTKQRLAAADERRG